ncbi:hypothetical protein PHYC_03717 [Phycisphaerales bacterium]|nr:hypothetical protein PHYC_03717 [Phycisphaerales bacterium]
MKRVSMLVAALCSMAGVSVAQPPAETPSERERPREMDPEALKARLERRLAENQRMETVIKQAIEKLDKGEPLGDLLRDLEPAGRFGRGEQGNRPEGGRRPDFDPEGPRGPRERGDGEGFGPMQAGQPLPEGERERVMEFLRGNLPLIAEKFAKLQDVDPDGADRMLARLVPRLREAQRVRKSDPVLANLRLEELKAGISVIEAVRDVRRAQDLPAGAEGKESKLAEATRELREKLVAQSETRMQLQEHEIESLTERIENLRKELEQKKAHRDGAVDEMLQKIVENREGPPGERPEPGRKRPD